jgi:uncharacterized protein (DUF427 family)
MRPVPEPTGPGEESAWDYPRPPRLEPTPAHLVVVLGGETIADTRRAWRVLETSHPPNYYIPRADVVAGALEVSEGTSYCEWKGRATYYTVRASDRVAVDAAWGYLQPSAAFAAIVDHVAFYAHRIDACFVDGEHVTPQPGGFYGGWITSRVKGPFKGGPGTRGW